MVKYFFMKWSFKMLLILSSTFLSNSICFSQKDKDNNRLKLIREIPADTIDVFIRNYGKDSLITKCFMDEYTCSEYE